MNNITALSRSDDSPVGRFETALVQLYYDGLIRFDSSTADLRLGNYWLTLLDETTVRISFEIAAEGIKNSCRWTRWMGGTGGMVLEDSGHVRCTSIDALVWLSAIAGTSPRTYLDRPPRGQ